MNLNEMTEIEKIYLKYKKMRRNKINSRKRTTRSRKERNHQLIVLGTIFELLGLDYEDYDLLLGICLEYFNKSEKELEIATQKGKLFKVKRLEMKEIDELGE